MSKMEPPPDYHAGQHHRPPHHGYNNNPGYPPPGPQHHDSQPPASHISGGYQPHYHQATQHAPQNQGMSNNFAPTISQPVSQATNVVVNTGDLYGYERERDWSTHICGCCEDVGGCLLTVFFPMCMGMTLASRMREIFCLPLLVPQWMTALRVKMRASNNIRGGIFTDCVMSTCCPLCVLCQMKRELDNINRRKLLRGL